MINTKVTTKYKKIISYFYEFKFLQITIFLCVKYRTCATIKYSQAFSDLKGLNL